jgi:oligoribonuclease (3'-5' exoribonuclease)
MATSSDRLVWIDCEMTGLDLEVDELVEIAVVITDYDLNPVDAGLSIVIKPDASALENMGEFVRAMHTESGLIEEIPNGVSLAEAEYEVLEYVLKHVPEEQKAPLAGNSIGTDRGFISKFMPRLDAHLHYRKALVPARVLQFARQERRPPRPRRHPRVDPRTALLPPCDLRRRSRSVEPGAADARRRRGGRVRGKGVVISSSCLIARRSAHGGYSSVGRAPGCGPGGRGFKPRYSPQ